MNRLATRGNSSSPRLSTCSSVMINKEDKTNIADEGLEKAPPSKTRVMVGVLGFSILVRVWWSISVDSSLLNNSSIVSLIVGRLDDRQDLHLPNPLIQSMTVPCWHTSCSRWTGTEKFSVYSLSSQLNKVLVLSPVRLKESGLQMIIALIEFLEGGPDLVSRRQMSNTLKLTQRETREQSVASFVVRIM
jgi:hypothetical protein